MIKVLMSFSIVFFSGIQMAIAFSVSTQNLYHYNKLYEERRAHLISEIREEGVTEIIGFQEAARWAGKENLYDVFLQETAYAGIYKKTNSFGVMHDAIALVSKWPTKELKSFELPKTKTFSRQFINIGIFQTTEGDIIVVNAHLSPFQENSWRRLAQAAFILDQIKKYPNLPVVILGDLNDTYESETLKVFRDAGYRDVLDGKQATYVPGENPLVTDDRFGASRLDYILYQPKQLTVKSAQIIFKKNWVSDHYGVAAEFSKLNL